MSIRAFVAVAVGVIFVMTVTTSIDILLHVYDVFPAIDIPINDTQAAIATAYRLLIGITGGWLTGRLVKEEPVRFASMVGYVGAVLGTVTLITTWDLKLCPRWYPIASAVLALPQAWIGGKLVEFQRRPPTRKGDSTRSS